MISKISFYTEDNKKLIGKLYWAKNFSIDTEKQVVIFVHGLFSNLDSLKSKKFGESLSSNGIAYFCFNGREVSGVFDFENCQKDIEAAVKEMKMRGFEKIHIMGHSLGCNKILLWEKQKTSDIKSVAFLSLVNLSEQYKVSVGEDAYEKAILCAKNRQLKGRELDELPKFFYFKPINAKVFLELFDSNSELNCIFREYSNENGKLLGLNMPVFVRYGTNDEISTDVIEDIRKLNCNNKISLGYISGANHSYYNKEQQVINEYIEFIKNC